MADRFEDALNLLLDYISNSESEDECENLLTNNKGEPDASKIQKSSTKLPLPNDFLGNSQKSNDKIDNSLHQGRIRSFPHERGNWATIIYIPLKKHFTKLFTLFKKELCDIGESLESIEEPHISLTKTLVIPYHWIQPLVETLTVNINQLSRFTIEFNSIELFCNEEKTRTFIALGANKYKSSLIKLVQVIDKAVEDFKLPKYYEEPNFHASISWCLNNQTEQIIPKLKKLNKIYQKFVSNNLELNNIHVSHLVMKTGNKFYSFPLN